MRHEPPPRLLQRDTTDVTAFEPCAAKEEGAGAIPSWGPGPGFLRAVDSAGWSGDPEGCQGPLWIVHTHGDRVTLAELLTQHPHTGELWAEEERRIEVHDVGVAARCWALTWSSATANRHDEPLVFGSPTTAGRKMADYTGPAGTARLS